MSFPIDPEGFLIPPAMRRIPPLSAVFGTRGSGLPSGPLATVHQIHSAEVIRVSEPGFAGDGDALITDTAGLTLAIKTADCVPILLADMHHHAVAAVHAGWRGTAKHIGLRAIEAMRAAFGTRPEDLLVAIGPSIGPCCFEVGPEVAGELGQTAPDQPEAKVKLDLSRSNRDQLEAAGVPPKSIEEASMCTFCCGELFWSFRRERENAGRMYSAIGIRKPTNQ